ncbi:MAG: hypothetical protein AB4206_11980 [Xenococcaceae cyanobacterium]
MTIDKLPIEISEVERTPLVNWLLNKRRRTARDHQKSTANNRRAAGENCQARKKS